MHKELCADDYYQGRPDEWKVSHSIITHLQYTLPIEMYDGPRSKELDDYRDLFLTNSDYSEFVFNNEEGITTNGWHGSYIGGYPSFMNGEFRSEDESRSITLLHISLLDCCNIGGFAYFFISEKNLKNLDFSNLIVMSDYD